MFHYSLRVIDEPKMSEIRILNLRHKKSILVDIYRQWLLRRTVRKNREKSGFRGKSWKLDFFYFLSILSFNVAKKRGVNCSRQEPFICEKNLKNVGCGVGVSEWPHQLIWILLTSTFLAWQTKPHREIWALPINRTTIFLSLEDIRNS